MWQTGRTTDQDLKDETKVMGEHAFADYSGPLYNRDTEKLKPETINNKEICYFFFKGIKGLNWRGWG